MESISLNKNIFSDYYLGFNLNNKRMYPYDYDRNMNTLFIGSFSKEEESLKKFILTAWDCIGVLTHNPKIICTDADNLNSYKFYQLEWVVEKGIKEV